jgi:hypothetical protein
VNHRWRQPGATLRLRRDAAERLGPKVRIN